MGARSTAELGSIVKSPSTAPLPPFDGGWLVASGSREAFLRYASDAAVNWSDELEQLHDDQGRLHFLDVATRRAILAAVDEADGSTIVDLGCSSGYLLEELRAAHPGRPCSASISWNLDCDGPTPRYPTPRCSRPMLVLSRWSIRPSSSSSARICSSTSRTTLACCARSRESCARGDERFSWSRPRRASTTTTTVSLDTSDATRAASYRERHTPPVLLSSASRTSVRSSSRCSGSSRSAIGVSWPASAVRRSNAASPPISRERQTLVSVGRRCDSSSACGPQDCHLSPSAFAV